MNSPKLRTGDWVEIKSKDEILKTLDKGGQLDGLPFMPEMFKFSGKRFRVYKRAHKTCDTVYPVRGRRVSNAVHLETRCDGEAHGGCQARCLLFWKEAWLKRVDGDLVHPAIPESNGDYRRASIGSSTVCTEQDVRAAALLPSSGREEDPTYVCQATRLPDFTTSLQWWDIRQYLEDYRSGNVGLRQILNGFIYSTYYSLSNAGIGLGPLMRWLYDRFRPLWHGTQFPRKAGTIPLGQPTPTERLNLQSGELVRVKSHDEILKSLNTEGKNRGLYFDAEMVPYCGGTYRVLSRVSRILDEKTGKLIKIKNDCLILEGVFCRSRYSYCRMFCPRSIYGYWREIWLERIPDKEPG
jgi:hypothetical protein